MAGERASPVIDRAVSGQFQAYSLTNKLVWAGVDGCIALPGDWSADLRIRKAGGVGMVIGWVP